MGELSQSVVLGGVDISPQGLDQRMTTQAAWTIIATNVPAPPHFEAIVQLLRFVLRSGCRLDTGKTQPSHFQCLLNLS